MMVVGWGQIQNLYTSLCRPLIHCITNTLTAGSVWSDLNWIVLDDTRWDFLLKRVAPNAKNHKTCRDNIKHGLTQLWFHFGWNQGPIKSGDVSCDSLRFIRYGSVPRDRFYCWLIFNTQWVPLLNELFTLIFFFLQTRSSYFFNLSPHHPYTSQTPNQTE